MRAPVHALGLINRTRSAFMTLDDIHKEISELRTMIEVQTDFIGIITSRSTLSVANDKALSELLGDVLEKHGVKKEATAERYENLCAKFLIVEQESLKASVSSADKNRPPSVSGPEAERN